jgi:hypothetical protein
MLVPFLIDEDELEQITQEDEEDKYAISKTYKIDFETGEILPEFINYGEAVRQAVIKAILTMRDRYIIYSSDYGCEIFYLLGKSYSEEYLQLEIPRLINEALMIDDRVAETKDFVVKKIGDELYISFNVVTDVGDTVEIEVTI